MANGNGSNLGFEERLWSATDKLRGTMGASEYKHVVLGLIFLKYISDTFEEFYNRIKAQESNYTTWKLCQMNLAIRGIDGDIL